MPLMITGVSDRAQRPDLWVNRAVRHPLQIPLRYRFEGTEEWSSGATVNLSESGVLFVTEDTLELNTRLEITFQTSSNPVLSSSKRFAQVVRRVLNNWPETEPAFGAKFF